MAKTTRKTDCVSTEPKTRAVRRKAATEASTETAEPKAAKITRRGNAAAARTTRKASTVTAVPVMAADRPAAAPAPVFSEPTHAEIAERAYHIHLRRQGWPGNPDHDWLQALEELRAERR
jgi:hypothetical protein